MILTDEEVTERLESESNLCKVIHKKNGGRTAGATQIPDCVRDLIAITDGRGKDIGEAFEVDDSSVSEIKKGLVGGSLDKNLQVVGRKASREDNAHEAALDVLMTSLSALQPKLVDPDLKAKDLSRIASDMSNIVGKIRGEDRAGVTNNTQVILIAPPQRKLEKYEVIEA